MVNDLLPRIDQRMEPEPASHVANHHSLNQARKPMLACARIVATGLAIGIGTAFAQSADIDQTIGAAPPAIQVELSPPQRTAILNAVEAEKRSIQPPADLRPSIGAQVPPSMELHMLPDQALAAAPNAKGFKYTVVQKQVVLVDPTTLRVVDVIDR
jgi:hypothetical protein